MKKLLSFTQKFYLVAFVMLMAAPAFGQLLYTNSITGTIDSSTPLTSGGISDPRITVSGLSRGAGVAPVTTSNAFAASGWTEANFTAADTAGDFFEWTITPGAGEVINFQNLLIALQRNNNLLGSSIFLRSSVDGFSTNVFSFNLTNTSNTNFTVPLTAPAFQNVSGAITFRIYAWGSASAAHRLQVNDFTFNGFVPGIFYNLITGSVPKILVCTDPAFTTGQVVNESLTVSGIMFGCGTVHNQGTDQFNVAGFDQLTQAGAVAASDYIEWVMTPNVGFEVDFSQLVLSFKVSNVVLNGQIELRSSLDGYAAPIQTFAGLSGGVTNTFFVDLNALPKSTSAVTFRLYAWGAPAIATIEVTDFNFDGVVAPDPLAPALLGSTAVSTIVFNNITYNVASAAQTVKVYGLNPNPPGYPATVLATANSTNVEVSADNISFGPTANVTLASAALHPLYIRMNPNYFGTQTFTPGVTLTSASFPNTVTINVQGNVLVTPPVATAASNITSNSFTANWNAVADADSYLLKVERQTVSQITQDFISSSPFPPAGWATGVPPATWSAGRALFNSEGEFMRAPSVNNPVEISFDLRQNDTNTKVFELQYSLNSGITYLTIETFTENSLPANVITNFVVDLSLFQNNTNVLFRFRKGDGSTDPIFLDNVVLKFRSLTTVPAYNDLDVGNVLSYNVTGLVDFTDYQYSVKAVKVGSTAASNVIQVKTLDLNTVWNGTSWSNGAPNLTRNAVINGNYNTATWGNFLAKDLTVNSGFTLTIANGNWVDLAGNFTNLGTDANVIVASGGNLIQRASNADVDGAITVRRNTQALMRLDYVGWGSPVENQNLLNFSPLTWGTRFYTFDTESNVYANGLDVINDSFESAKGYLIRMPNNHPTTPTVWMGEFKGVPHTGTIDFTMVNDGAAKNNNFIANPYPSAINISRFVNANISQITGEIWVWRKTNGASGSAYYTWAGNLWSNPDGLPTSVAATEMNVGQGFIVQANIGETNVRFTNSMRSTANGVSFRPGNSDHSSDNENVVQTEEGEDEVGEKHVMWLKMTKDAEDVTSFALAYSAGATNGFDTAIDGKSFNDGDVEFTSLVNTTSLAVQQRALPFVTTDEVPLRFKTTIAGTYTISLSGMTGLFLGDQNIYLKDLLTNVTHDLKAQDYTFTSVAGTFDTRFKIVYENVTLGVDDNFIPENGVIAFVDSKVLNVTSVNQTIEKVVVYDISGRKVVEQQKVNATSTQLSLSGIARQMLLVQITTDLGVFTKKVVF
jgi:hypothetical protein